MSVEFDVLKIERHASTARTKRQVTIRLDGSTIEYFKELAEDSGMPYQTLINLYLRECAEHHKRLAMTWDADA